LRYPASPFSVMGIFEIELTFLFARTTIFLISAFQVARIMGGSHRWLANNKLFM
jgi:hypothetical protein